MKTYLSFAALLMIFTFPVTVMSTTGQTGGDGNVVDCRCEKDCDATARAYAEYCKTNKCTKGVPDDMSDFKAKQK